MVFKITPPNDSKNKVKPEINFFDDVSAHSSPNNKLKFFDYKPKASKFIILCARLFSCFTCLFKTNLSRSEIFQKKEYNFSILKFFSVIICVLRAKETFISRSIYRNVKHLKEFHYNLINDLSFFRRHKNKFKNDKLKIHSHSYGRISYCYSKIKRRFHKIIKFFRKIKAFILSTFLY